MWSGGWALPESAECSGMRSRSSLQEAQSPSALGAQCGSGILNGDSRPSFNSILIQFQSS